MLATGGTLVAAINFLLDRGADDVTAICLLAAPEGVAVHGGGVRPASPVTVVTAGSTSGSTSTATSSPASATPATASTASSDPPSGGPPVDDVWHPGRRFSRHARLLSRRLAYQTWSTAGWRGGLDGAGVTQPRAQGHPRGILESVIQPPPMSAFFADPVSRPSQDADVRPRRPGTSPGRRPPTGRPPWTHRPMADPFAGPPFWH